MLNVFFKVSLNRVFSALNYIGKCISTEEPLGLRNGDVVGPSSQGYMRSLGAQPGNFRAYRAW